MKEINQYIKPAIIGFIISEIIGKIFLAIYKTTQSPWLMLMLGIIVTVELYFINQFLKGICKQIERKDREISELKENQEYMIQLLRAQRTEE